MDISGISSEQTGDSETRRTGESRVTPQLVKEIADMIYAMLLHDLKIEEERLGLSKSQSHPKFGRKL
jgi:hypothetical protein